MKISKGGQLRQSQQDICTTPGYPDRVLRNGPVTQRCLDTLTAERRIQPRCVSEQVCYSHVMAYSGM